MMVIVNRTVLSKAKSLVQSSVVSYPSSMAVKIYLRKAWISSRTAYKILIRKASVSSIKLYRFKLFLCKVVFILICPILPKCWLKIPHSILNSLQILWFLDEYFSSIRWLNIPPIVCASISKSLFLSATVSTAKLNIKWVAKTYALVNNLRAIYIQRVGWK